MHVDLFADTLPGRPETMPLKHLAENIRSPSLVLEHEEKMLVAKVEVYDALVKVYQKRKEEEEAWETQLERHGITANEQQN